ncbi:hypothetical protein [Sulfolobus spindle-shaped virus]|nr:hypothetical protein [Sulfolobus spindle-shaped virus]QGA87279.1 hypothetical protein [Sulfolobus spindle-shaped virus]QGA87305.1 hypothetical protein [Sulfolobus spindle-shaped virus]
MGTKLVVYVLLVDVLLALMIGAFSGISLPSIPQTPSYQQAVQTMSSISISVGWPAITLIPSFSILGATVPALQIPAVTLFSFNFGFLAPLYFGILVVDWFFTIIFDVVSYIVSVISGGVTILVSVPVIGPFLTAILVLLNFILLWELLKLILGVRL